jgi:hypothetical protein
LASTLSLIGSSPPNKGYELAASELSGTMFAAFNQTEILLKKSQVHIHLYVCLSIIIIIAIITNLINFASRPGL